FVEAVLRGMPAPALHGAAPASWQIRDFLHPASAALGRALLSPKSGGRRAVEDVSGGPEKWWAGTGLNRRHQDFQVLKRGRPLSTIGRHWTDFRPFAHPFVSVCSRLRPMV